MKKRLVRNAMGLIGAMAILCATIAVAQEDDRGDWSLTGADAGQSGWQKDEQILTPESAASNFKFLWKIKLGEPSNSGRSFSEPLLAGRLINAQGFKDIVYWGSGDTLYAVDSELGSLIWKKQFASPAASAAPGCGVSSLGILMEPPIVIHFRRRRAPGTPSLPCRKRLSPPSVGSASHPVVVLRVERYLRPYSGWHAPRTGDDHRRRFCTSREISACSQRKRVRLELR